MSFGERWARAAVAVGLGLALGTAGCGARTLQAADPTAPATAGALGTEPPPAPVPAGSPATEITEFSAVVDGRLLLPGGARISLADIKGDIYAARETVDGWLVNVRVDAEHESLWLVRPDKSLRRLVNGASGTVAVAPDGRRFAWRDGDTLRTGHLTLTGKVEADRSTPAPKRGQPFQYTGEAVLLGYTETGGGGYEHLDVWLPARGRYVSSWQSTAHVVVVYGPAPDGRSFIGLVLREAGKKSACLANLDPAAHLRATRTACLPVDLVDYFGRVSPRGRWLAAGAFDKEGRLGTAVIDLTTVFGHPTVATMWVGEPGGDWLDARTFLVAQGPAPIRFTRFTVGRAAGEPVTLHGVPDTEVPTLVSTLG